MIDLTRLPAPAILETVDYEAMQAGFLARFVEQWNRERLRNPALPAWDVGSLKTDSAVIASRAWSFLRLLDRERVNDAIRAVLAPLAGGADLDNVVARVGIERLVITPATDRAPAVMESDERLLARYLLAMTRPAAGSADRYILEAMTAWPLLHHAVVIGHRVHGRRGDVDLVIAGPGGRDATDAEMALVRAAAGAASVVPEATSLYVLRAIRREYEVRGQIVLPVGPDAEAVRLEAVNRIAAACSTRTLINTQVPRDYLASAAYGLSVTRFDLSEPVTDITADPYTIPVCKGIALNVEVSA